jgi:hypothetical protein
VYHGGGGFIHSEVYNMPVWMRQFHIKSIQKYIDDQENKRKEKMEQNQTPQNKVTGPNIEPSSTYNFKK